MKLHHFAGAMALALGVATAASAQGTPQGGGPPHGGRMGPKGGAERRTQMDAILFKGITLTQKQKDSLEKLNATQEAQMKALWESFKGKRPDAEGQKKIRRMREQQAAQFRAILTEDQQPIYDQNVADIKAVMQQHMQMRNGGEGPGSPPPPPQQ